MSFVKSKPVFLFLLPVFFVLHGFTRNYNFVPVGDALLLILIYTGSAVGITLLSWSLYRDLTKASLIAFVIMAYHFFFGSIHDLMKTYFAETFITRYIFILPVSFLFLLVFIVWLKKRKRPFQKPIYYLNILFLLLILIDTIWLSGKIIDQKDNSSSDITNAGLIKCDTCKKPDIFFIILDGYSGNKALKEKFDFDNSAFENELRHRGFHIVSDSRSNYNYTPFSTASILNMNYPELNMKTKGQGNLNYSYRMIRDNLVVKFLEASGYTVYNYSIFDLAKQPAKNYDNILPVKTKLITAQTFLSRLKKDIGGNIIMGKFRIKAVEKKFTYSYLQNNNNFIRFTTDIAAQQQPSPKFVYAHLIMPHFPYYFDSQGRPFPYDSLTKESFITNKHNYIEYLQYCNKQILQFANDILSSSPTPPVIIFLGDHGFRYFAKKEERKYCFMNLAAVYLPSGNYSNFYTSMSAVNMFPVILNTEFQQHIPLLKDSTIYLWD